MTPQAQRGRRLFLCLATVIVLHKSVAIGLALSHGFANVDWFQKVLLPASLAMCVVFMWDGENWLRWPAALTCLLGGGFQFFICAHGLITLALITPFKAAWLYFQFAVPLVLLFGITGTFYLAAGFLFLLSPSLQAFFRFQRERISPIDLS